MDEEELGEETVLLDSPLDKLEPYGVFKATLLGTLFHACLVITLTDFCTGMQQEQPDFYSNLMGHLSAEDQNTLQHVMSQADLIVVKQQEEEAAALAAANAQAQQPSPAANAGAAS